MAKMKVVKKPATKARQGINPFTKEPTVFKAKPARKLVKIRALKGLKDAVKPYRARARKQVSRQAPAVPAGPAVRRWRRNPAG